MDMPERSYDRPISLKDHFRFRCSRCTACCRHVTGAVPLNPLDVFKLTRYLRGHETGPVCTDDVLMHFASPSMLTGAGYFVYFIRSVGEDERCVFLNGNRCSIQESKPVACRMYPLEAAPEVDGSFHIVLSTERTHHFTGNPIKVKNWFYRNMSEDMREFYRYDFDSAPGIGHYLVLRADENGFISDDRFQTAIAKAKEDFMNDICQTTLAPLSDQDIAFLAAMAKDEQPSKMADIVARLNCSSSLAQTYKRRLIHAGVIEQYRRGEVRFAVPYLRDYLYNTYSDF